MNARGKRVPLAKDKIARERAMEFPFDEDRVLHRDYADVEKRTPVSGLNFLQSLCGVAPRTSNLHRSLFPLADGYASASPLVRLSSHTVALCIWRLVVACRLTCNVDVATAVAVLDLKGEESLERVPTYNVVPHIARLARRSVSTEPR